MARAKRRATIQQAPQKFRALDWLIWNEGDISIGRVGSIRGVAGASDTHQTFAMLVRRTREPLGALLLRLDAAVDRALEDEEPVDEVNGPGRFDGDEPTEEEVPGHELPDPTAKQGQYFAFIALYSKLHRIPPAESDLQRYFGVSPASVHSMIRTLEHRRLVEGGGGGARGLRVVLDPDRIPDLD